MNITIGSRVRIVADDDKENSNLIGLEGRVIGFKWNRDRKENNLPVVQLNSFSIASSRTLWYEVLPTTVWEIMDALSRQQICELFIENFGETNAYYHTLDEIPLFKLIEKLERALKKDLF